MMIRKTILLAVTLLMLFSYGPQAVINGLIIFGVLMVLSLPAVLSNSRYSIDAGIALLFLVMTSFNNVIVSLVTAYLIIALSPIQGELLKRDGLKIQIVFVAFRLLEAIAYFIILTYLPASLTMMLALIVLHVLVNYVFSEAVVRAIKVKPLSRLLLLKLMIRTLIPNILFLLVLNPMIARIFI
jgi:hypothetical protein